MPVWLASLGLKDAFYGVLILFLGGAGVWYHHHVLVEGEDKIIAADSRAVAAEAQRDSALKTATALANSVAQGDYNHAIAIPITNAPIPDRLCHITLRSGKTVIAAAGSAGGSPEAASGSEDASPATELQRFADAAVEITRDSDAQVEALQTIILNLRNEMEKTDVR